MSHFIRRLAVASMLTLGLVAGRDASAQGVVFSSYGSTCEFFGQPSTLSGTFDPVSSAVTLSVSAPQSCCNTFLAGQFILFGAQQDPGIPLPIPGVVPGCVLSVQPIFLVAALPQGQDRLRFSVPALPPGLQFFAQGLNDYFTTIGFSHDLQFSNGLALTTL